MNFNYHIPTKILFGPGKLHELAGENLPGKKALIVISAGGSLKKHGYLDRLLKTIHNQHLDYVLFDKILSNPRKEHVMEGASLAKKSGCDFVIGFGGGSAIDSAKSIALMTKNPGDYWDYVSGGTGKGLAPPNGALPIVAITTTAGTGTEADPWTVITNEATNEKIGYGNSFTFPVLSVVDPELMLSVPQRFTAYQGFDALFHSTEGFIAKIATPISDAYALKSIELIATHLPAAVRDGSNLKARTQIALANTLSGMVESTSGCTSEHSMEHALSAYHPDLPHGAGLIMLSEAYYTFFTAKVPDRFVAMAMAMGVDTDLLPLEDRPRSFVKALVKLQADCGVLDLKMSDYGIKKEELPKLAENARQTMGGLFEVDPYHLTPEETIKIMNNAYK
jgi:alcohol dehydrogenase